MTSVTHTDPGRSGETATLSKPTKREELIGQFLEQLAAMKRRFAAAIPADVHQAMTSVTPHQIEALCLMDGSGEGMTMNELAKAQRCALSTATALVDRLVTQDLAERSADPGDRRLVRISPTPEARKLIEFALTSKRQLGQELLAGLTNSEIEQLVALLGKVAAVPEPAND